MFGYVVINKPELKCREYEEYRSYYCGLCKALGKNNGLLSRFAVNYDLTFLSMLYADLYDPKIETKMEHCIIHPVAKRFISHHEYETYCADMTTYLAWLKCMDDWVDDKKIPQRTYAAGIDSRAKAIEKKYPDKCQIIKNYMAELSKKEKANCNDLDQVSGDFGKILEEIFVMKKDMWEGELRKTGFFLGKYIYILDAYEDLAKDIAKNNYNPLKSYADREDFDDFVKEILKICIAECCRNFEILPLVELAPILKNILYMGVWTGYDRAKNERNREQVKDGSI